MVDPDMQGIVMDIGHWKMKVGFSGDESPRSCNPTVVGTPKDGIPIGMDLRDFFVGDEAIHRRNILNLSCPIPTCGSKSVNWDYLQKIFHISYYIECHVTPEEHPTLVTTLPHMDKRMFEKITLMMFESFNVPAFYMADPTVLGLYASGRLTGQVLDCGSSQISTVSVFEGHPIQHSKLVLEDIVNTNESDKQRISGDLLESYFSKKLCQDNKFQKYDREEKKSLIQDEIKKMYYSFHIPEKYDERLRQVDPTWKKQDDNIEEDPCRNMYIFTAEGYKNRYRRNYKKMKGSIRGDSIPFELPDGNFVDIGDERYDVPEILFNPSMIREGKSLPGIHQLIQMSIDNCAPPELRPILYKNIVLCGGTTRIDNFWQKMYIEMSELVKSKYDIKIVADAEREYAAWIGGSILTNLTNFQNDWLSKMEYDDGGWERILLKCQRVTMDNRKNTHHLFLKFGKRRNCDGDDDEDMKERRIYVLEDLRVPGFEEDDHVDNFGFTITLADGNILKLKFKSLILL